MWCDVRGFVGRGTELRALGAELEEARATGQGRFITVRGRRQVGKSWLVEKWLEDYDGPSVFFEAHGYTETRELERFREAVAKSSLPSSHTAVGVAFNDLQAALLTAAAEARVDRPSVIVIDEFPDLCERRRDAEGNPAPSPQEGAIRAAWRELQRRPIVLVLIGSDLSMMERLTSYGFPLYQRPTRQLVVEPLSPGEVSQITGRTGADAIDAYLVTGGFPRIVGLWKSGGLEAFIRRELDDPGSEFVRSAERILDGELPVNIQARSILSVIGAGERTHSGIASGTGIRANNLSVPLRVLADKRIIESALPLSIATSDARRYMTADPYLRFWLRFIEPIRGEIDRGLGASRASGIAAAFPDYAGHAVEPIVRRGLERMSAAGDRRLRGARVVGGFWTKDNQTEIDLVGADRDAPPVKKIAFIGTVKWRMTAPMDGGDIAELERAAQRMAGAAATTSVVAVSRTGFGQIARPLAAAVGPDELLAAFPSD